ncbi:MAG: hypothetical protein H6613_14785 [Ignavibacteriales bacterium]|nr:hypothetical protein [Ignavibacteriales bacterium]
MLDYNLPYHIIKETEDEIYLPKVSFKTLEDAKEFVKFAPIPNLIIVKTEELKNFYLGNENNNYEI